MCGAAPGPAHIKCNVKLGRTTMHQAIIYFPMRASLRKCKPERGASTGSEGAHREPCVELKGDGPSMMTYSSSSSSRFPSALCCGCGVDGISTGGPDRPLEVGLCRSPGATWSKSKSGPKPLEMQESYFTRHSGSKRCQQKGGEACKWQLTTCSRAVANQAGAHTCV